MAAAAVVGDRLCPGSFASLLPFKALFLPRKIYIWAVVPTMVHGALCVQGGVFLGEGLAGGPAPVNRAFVVQKCVKINK